jgi:hypothetical protein
MVCRSFWFSVLNSHQLFLYFYCFFFIYNGLPILSRFQKIAEMAHANGALVLVDNSILSPVLSQPLELGAGMANALWL